MPSPRRPRRVAVAGWVLVGFGSLAALGALAAAAADPSARGPFVIGGVAAIVLLTIGIGLIRGTKWAWVLGVMLGLFALFNAVQVARQPKDLGPGPGPALVFLGLSGGFALTVLGCLLTPTAVRWASGRALPPRPDSPSDPALR
ncbi:MAG TPA: hypothetical protein VK646_11945 [Actinomycetota bacterium]|nr:hypothetical protein [Actinomycetota bacterium]